MGLCAARRLPVQRCFHSVGGGAVHVEDLRIECQPIYKSRDHHLGLKKLRPLRKFKIRRYYYACSFGAFGNHLKQKFGLTAVKRQITQLINYEQVEFPEGFLKPG